MDVCGALDEANSMLGLARSMGLEGWCDVTVGSIQRDLFFLGNEVSCGAVEASKLGVRVVDDANVRCLEQSIDHASDRLTPLSSFVIPGGTKGASALHCARAIVRRAERGLVALGCEEMVRREQIAYLNRVGDLLFVLARWENSVAGVGDVVVVDDGG